MESRASDVDSDGTDSLYADSSPAQNPPSGHEPQQPSMNDPAIDNDDSESDISMSADSDDENESADNSSIQVSHNGSRFAPSEIPQPEPLEESSKKRKYDSTDKSNGKDINGYPLEDRKRLKPNEGIHNHQNPNGIVPKDKSLLPSEIWHRIFTFCSPRVLGSLLQVNKAFNAYLDPSATGQVADPLPNSAAHLLHPDNIWKASKRLIDLPAIPAPLSGKSELEMWKLSCGSLCQYCNKKRQVNSAIAMDQWHSGPGENGVSPIWAFGIRSCGACLPSQSTKEIDLLLSSVIPSPLMAALPFVFVTNELHLISPSALQTGQQPPHIQINKYFSNCQIQEIKQEFEEVKAMGTATAEEWLKGLDGRGKERRNDAARWERWEASGGLGRMRSLDLIDSRTGTTNPPPHANGTMVVSTATNGTIPSYPIPNLQQLQHLAAVLKAKQLANQPPSNQNNSVNPPPRFDSPAQNGFSPFTPRTQTQPKHERTKEEVAELKAARRMEIEKRCLQLDPPITAGVLAHMASFQAAIQIIQPLTDSAWEVLKPRLLSQRGEAEQRENDRLAQTRVVQERFDQLRYQDMQKSDPKALDESQWDDLQAPLRARIGGYADEIIRDGWNSGEKVDYDNSPRFAAEVLVYVRKRFYAEVAKDEAAVRATGREPESDPPDGPYSRKLTLENMKWVFDTKVKTHTEPFRKELFVCSACEYANKYYGFEGVIQHFAAKHTSTLSMGSIVVHWKSEWPEYPPFNPDPSSVPINAFYPAAPGTNTPYSGAGPSAQQNYGYGGYQQTPVSGPMHVPPHGYQESPGPYYGHPQFGEQYSGPQNGPYAPPPSYPDNSQAYQATQYSTAPPGASAYNDPSHNYAQQGFGGQYQTPTSVSYPSSKSITSYPATVLTPSNQQAGYAPLGNQYGSSYIQSQSYHSGNSSQAPPRTEEYMTQLQHVARNARDTWNSIGNVKEVPGSLKVYTVLYHLLKSFHATFNDTPPLAMIVDGLSNNKDMRPVRNVNGLLCKACSLGMAGSNPNLPKKHFSFPQLVNHFFAVHEQGISEDSVGHLPDWTRDMVELPDTAKLTSVVNAPGLDDKRLALFTEAVPEILQPSEPSLDEYREDRPQSYADYSATEYGQLAPSQDNHHKYYSTNGSGRPSETESVTYESGEYDPRNPGDLSAVSGSFQTDIKGGRNVPLRNDSIPSRYSQNIDDITQDSSRSYAEQRPSSHVIPINLYGRAREELPIYTDRPIRYLEPEEIEYRVRREPQGTYGQSMPLERDYADSNSQAYVLNQASIPVNDPYTRTTQPRSLDGPASQQSRIYDVVAQISQQAQKAQQARDRKSDKEDPVDGGSEDGEVRIIASSNTAVIRNPAIEESNAAERFLNEFRPGEPYEGSVTRLNRDDNPPAERNGNVRYIYEDREPSRRVYAGYEDDVPIISSTRRIVRPTEELSHDGYPIHERASSKQVGNYAEEPIQRERSPELVDHRYKLNNAIYLEERQNSQGAYRAPSRYARYESVRLENDRVRSRSPPYVKSGPQPGQYRERSPETHPQPVYRNQIPPPAIEEVVYERPPPSRQEYHRIYVGEPRPRESRYEEAYELVRVSDPQGDYMIRRPVRREPVYAAYEDEVYTRQPAYESRQPLARTSPQFTEDEYDPKHPEPPPVPVTQVRYQ